MDGSETWPLHQHVSFSHHRVSLRAQHPHGAHVAGITAEPEAGTAAAALLRCPCWGCVSGWVTCTQSKVYNLLNIIATLLYDSPLQFWLWALTVYSGGSSCGLKVRFSGTTLFSTKAQTGEYPLINTEHSHSCFNHHVPPLYPSAVTENAPWLSPPVNLSFSLVLLLGSASSFRLHSALRPPGTHRQANASASASCCGLHPHLLSAAS